MSRYDKWKPHGRWDATPSRGPMDDLRALQRAFNHGRGCGDGGRSLMSDCPYPDGSAESIEWGRGYSQGQSDFYYRRMPA